MMAFLIESLSLFCSEAGVFYVQFQLQHVIIHLRYYRLKVGWDRLYTPRLLLNVYLFIIRVSSIRQTVEFYKIVLYEKTALISIQFRV